MCQTLYKHIPTLFGIFLAHSLDEGLWGGLILCFIGSCPILQNSLVLFGGALGWWHNNSRTSWLAVISMQPALEFSFPTLLPMAVFRVLTLVTRARSPNAPQFVTLQRLECDCTPQKIPSTQSVLIGFQTVLVMDHVSSSLSGNSFFLLLPAAVLSMGFTPRFP